MRAFGDGWVREFLSGVFCGGLEFQLATLSVTIFHMSFALKSTLLNSKAK